MPPYLTSLFRRSTLGLLGLACASAAASPEAGNGGGPGPAPPDLSSVEPPAGLTVSGTIVGEAWGALGGGVEAGHWFVAGADLVAELPAVAIGGPRAGTLYAHGRALKNRRREGTFADYVGGVHPVSNTFASDQLRVYNLYYRHAPADAGWQFKLGQLAMDDDFAISQGGSHFINAAFGALPSLTATPLRSDRGGSPAFPIYSVAAPGVWFEQAWGEAITWQTGLYHGGPGADRRGNHGFRWAPASHSGVVAATEWIVAHRVGTRAATSKFGLSAHTGSFDDFQEAAAGRADVHVRGLWSVYGTHDLALLGPDPERPRLMAFGRIGAAPQQDRAMISYYGDLGLVSHGPFAARPKDVAGAGLSYSRFGRGFRLTNALARTETLVETFYAVAVTERLTVTADVQWVFNAARDPASGDRGTAAVVGLRTRVAW